SSPTADNASSHCLIVAISQEFPITGSKSTHRRPGYRCAMSVLDVTPPALASAAAELETIGADLTAAHASAAVGSTGLLAAGADEVSAATAALFTKYGQAFSALGAQASAFHAEFVRALGGASNAYADTEAANVSPQWFSPWKALTGRPLVGNGADGKAGTGRA